MLKRILNTALAVWLLVCMVTGALVFGVCSVAPWAGKPQLWSMVLSILLGLSYVAIPVMALARLNRGQQAEQIEETNQ